jgi:hypothetical protein
MDKSNNSDVIISISDTIVDDPPPSYSPRTIPDRFGDLHHMVAVLEVPGPKIYINHDAIRRLRRQNHTNTCNIL